MFAEDRYQVLIELQRDVLRAKDVYLDIQNQMFPPMLPIKRRTAAERAMIGETSGFDAKMDKLLAAPEIREPIRSLRRFRSNIWVSIQR